MSAQTTDWGWRDLGSGDVLAILNESAARQALANPDHAPHIVSRQSDSEWSPA